MRDSFQAKFGFVVSDTFLYLLNFCCNLCLVYIRFYISIFKCNVYAMSYLKTKYIINLFRLCVEYFTFYNKPQIMHFF